MAVNNPYNTTLSKYRAKKKAELEDARKKAKAARDKAKSDRETRQKQLQEQQDIVKNNTEQPKGLAKFTPIIIQKGSHIAMTMAPTLLELAKELFPEGIDANSCPDFLGNEGQIKAKSLLLRLNGVITDLNNTSKTLDDIATVAGITAGILGTVQTVSKVLKYSIPPVSIASKTIPLIPGIIVSALDDLDWINNNLLYDDDGTPRLPKAIAGVGGITASIAMVSFTIKNVVDIIVPLKDKLEKCLPPIIPAPGEDPSQVYEVDSLSSSTLEFAKLGNSDFEEKDPLTYNGFVIRIETIPFTPTVNRYQAVGYTVSGIPLIKGELSFTSNAQILVEELKFIIDRDNLKAY